MKHSINPLDHIVVGTPSLPKARARLEAIGFQVQPDAHHPFGTGNCNVFFANGTYFEPLAVTDRDAEIAAVKAANPFVQRYDAYRFRHGYGPLMAAFTINSATELNNELAAQGLSAGDVLSFTRKQALPEGGETTIGVHLALSADLRAPDVTLFACEHLSRDILWRQERTVHPNTVMGISRVIFVEENPTDFQYLFQLMTGDREIRTTSVGLEFDLPNALVSVVTPAAFAAMGGDPSAYVGRGPRIAAVELMVADMGKANAHWSQAGVKPDRFGDHFIVPNMPGFPTMLFMREGEVRS